MDCYDLAPCLKYMHLLTAPQGWASDVLHGDPKEVPYEETIRATDDQFGDELTAEYHNQLKTWIQDNCEPPKEPSTVSQQVTHHAFVTQHENHVCKEPGRKSGNGQKAEA